MAPPFLLIIVLLWAIIVTMCHLALDDFVQQSICLQSLGTDCQLHLALSADEVLAASHTRIVPSKPHSLAKSRLDWPLPRPDFLKPEPICMHVD
jgi:hypothetical protein